MLRAVFNKVSARMYSFSERPSGGWNKVEKKRGQTNRNKNVYENGEKGRNGAKRIPGKIQLCLLSVCLCVFLEII